MTKFVETYKLKSQEYVHATYTPTTGDALDGLEFVLDFSCANEAIKAPDEITVTIEWVGEPELN